MRQLPLGVRLQDRAVFETFFPGVNAEAVDAVRALAAGQGPRGLYLHGAAGAGRSHLLQAACAAVPGAAYLPLGDLQPLGPEVLAGLGDLPLLAVDDLQRVAGDAAWENAFFALYHDCLQSGARLLVSASAPELEAGIALPDLRSRLAALPHYALRPQDEAGQREALRTHAAARGLQLPDETLSYLQRRFARDMASLQALLEKLDVASLEAQRPLTVPFIRTVLGDPAQARAADEG